MSVIVMMQPCGNLTSNTPLNTHLSRSKHIVHRTAPHSVTMHHQAKFGSAPAGHVWFQMVRRHKTYRPDKKKKKTDRRRDGYCDSSIPPPHSPTQLDRYERRGACKMYCMVSRKTKHAKTTTSEEQKKALVCVVHSQSSAGRSFVYFSCCQRLEKL